MSKKSYNDYNSENYKFTLCDSETNKEYTLVLGKLDYQRALTDNKYLASLLQHAKLAGLSENNYNNIDCNGEEIEEPVNDINEASNINKHIWQYNEAKALIDSVATHIDELNHPKKRKFMFENVANDMATLKYAVTATQCQVKWKSLVRTYKNYKDNRNETGRGRGRFFWYEEMDEILGNKPSTACEHTLESGIDTTCSAANITEAVELENSYTSDIEPIQSEEGTSTTADEIIDNTPPRKKKKTNLNEQYFMLKKEEYKKKELRHKEKIEIENKKIELLQKYLSVIEKS